MANIGTFTLGKNDVFTGTISTLSFNEPLTIKPVAGKDNDPTHSVFYNDREIGAAWAHMTDEGEDYCEVQIEDPSIGSFFAELVPAGPGTFSLLTYTASQSLAA